MCQQRSCSFRDIDHTEASGILTDILKEADVFVGGSSVGKGLKKAARQFLQKKAKDNSPDFLKLPGAQDLVEQDLPLEEAFYVVDLGMIVSQIYQWRRFFPRAEPFYAVKCNPDPIILKAFAILGCNFDCASRTEIRLVEKVCEDLPRKPEIIYANPCKARQHLMEAVARGVRLVTFDNATEVAKCAMISKKIQLVLRIMTDDRGSQCRLSSKFGAPRIKWRPLLVAARHHGLQVVGVSFHVGSGCRDASRYEEALKDAREIFDMAEQEFGMKMSLLDIGGGFPGETHSMWNPAEHLDEDEDDGNEGKKSDGETDVEEERFMTFTEIAEKVAPVIDELFPEESGVRVIAEPGRYLVAACSTLCCAVISARSNEVDTSYNPEPIDNKEAAMALHEMTREDELNLVYHRGLSLVEAEHDSVLATIHEELAGYSKLFAAQQLAQQEVDVYNDSLDLFKEGIETAEDLLGPPREHQKNRRTHSVEGMQTLLVLGVGSDEEEDPGGILSLAAAGEAAVSGMVLQAVADSAPLQDDYAYYVNDGVYGAFNNIMFDHAIIRPRVLRGISEDNMDDGHGSKSASDSDLEPVPPESLELFASTVFGPTCDSIDVIARSVLLPKLKVGDWMYFQNMGAYTMAAASEFNGFTPSDRFYVCSVMPEYFEALLKGPDEDCDIEEKDD